MLLRAIYSYQQTPCQDMYLHIYQDYVLVQNWKHLPTSKAKYQLPWIKRLAVDEALRTKRSRLIIYFRVSSQSPEGCFERGGWANCELVQEKGYWPYICHDQSTLGNMISKILITFSRCMRNPCRERKSALEYCRTEKPKSIPTVTGVFHLHCILRMEG